MKFIASEKEDDLSDNPKYHAAYHRGWQAGGILGQHVRRWEVEVSYCDAMQQLGLDSCQMQNLEGARRHWYLVWLMFNLLT